MYRTRTKQAKHNIMMFSLGEAFNKLWSNKIIFLILIISQFAFLFILLFSQLFFQVQILQSAQSIIDYVDKIETSELDSDLSNILGEDPLLISAKYNEMIFFVYELIVAFLAIYLIINGFNWSMTQLFFGKTTIKEFFNYYLKFIIISLVFFIPTIVFITLVITNKLFISMNDTFLKVLGTLFLFIWIISVYFCQIAYTEKTGMAGFMKNFSESIKSIFNIGIIQVGIIGFGFLINLIILAIFGAILVYIASFEPSFYILMLFSIFLICCFIMSRIFLIELVRNVINWNN